MRSPAHVHRTDAWTLVASAALVALTLLPVLGGGITRAEESVFRSVNQAPEMPHALAWGLMQVGNVGSTAVAAGLAWLRRRRELAAALAVGGIATWVLAKVVKGVVERGRPAAVLEDIVLRHASTTGRGWVSGHAAVAAALLTIAWPALSRRWRIGLVVVIAPMYVVRVYVGEHLPLDMIGGAAFGVLCGQVVVVAQRRIEAWRDAPVARTDGVSA